MHKKRLQLIRSGVSVIAPLCFLAGLTASTIPPKSASYYKGADIREQSVACLDCHDEHRVSLNGTVHEFAEGGAWGIGCVGCHDGAETHMEDPNAENISTPGRMTAAEQGTLCARCHSGDHQTAMSSSDPHALAGLACSDCHAIHGGETKNLLIDAMHEYCGSCHVSVKSQFTRRSSHPVEAGQMTCMSCHDLSGTADKLFTQGHDWKCQSCHSQQAGPFIHEHTVSGMHLVAGGGCIECHEPHGSANDRLLVQPGNTLCIQCHTVPSGHRTEHAGLGTKLPCVDCHSGVHGSFDNSKFLDPDLGTRLFPNCYQSGCHATVE